MAITRHTVPSMVATPAGKWRAHCRLHTDLLWHYVVVQLSRLARPWSIEANCARAGTACRRWSQGTTIRLPRWTRHSAKLPWSWHVNGGKRIICHCMPDALTSCYVIVHRYYWPMCWCTPHGYVIPWLSFTTNCLLAPHRTIMHQRRRLVLQQEQSHSPFTSLTVDDTVTISPSGPCSILPAPTISRKPLNSKSYHLNTG